MFKQVVDYFRLFARAPMKRAIIPILVTLAALVSIALLVLRALGPLLPPYTPPSEGSYYQPHPILGHAHRPNARRQVTWPEHPNGSFVMATNAQGLRADEDLPKKPQGVRRLLVVGDSHTDGVLNNNESFTQLLEATLNREGSSVQVLNAGVGYYGPDHYARALQAWTGSQPDAVLVLLFMGNDPLDTLRVREAAGHMAVPRPEGYYARLETAQGVLGPGIAQGLNQLFLFARRPALQVKAQALTLQALLALHSDCLEGSIPLAVAALPSKLRLEGGQIGAPLQDALAALDLPPSAAEAEAVLAAAIVGELTDSGVPAIDLAPELSCAPTPCFWNADHHLSVAGNAAVARALLGWSGLRGLVP